MQSHVIFVDVAKGTTWVEKGGIEVAEVYTISQILCIGDIQNMSDIDIVGDFCFSIIAIC